MVEDYLTMAINPLTILPRVHLRADGRWRDLVAMAHLHVMVLLIRLELLRGWDAMLIAR